MRALVAVTAVSLSGCASLVTLMHPAVPRPVAPDQVNPEFKDREGAEAESGGPKQAGSNQPELDPKQPASVPFYLQAPVVIEVPAPKPKRKLKLKPKATRQLKLPPGVLPGQQPPPPPPCPTPAKETTT